MQDPVLQLLFLCTRFESSTSSLDQLKAAAARISSWENLPARAEQHGLAPLAYFHLKNIPDSLPPLTLRTLKGQGLRDRLINQVRTRQVAAIAACFQQAQIPLLFLKGAALAHLLYPEPGLRPMSDLDLLVDRAALDVSWELLKNLGYNGSPPAASLAKSRHLPPLYQSVDGFSIGLELHFALFQHPDGRPWFQMQDLSSPPLPFKVGTDGRALSLGREDMLFHLCRHAFFNNSGFDSMRLIWVADIVNYANRFSAEIDWDKLRRLYPPVLHALALLHPISPLSENVISSARLKPFSSSAAAGVDFQGWPVSPVSQWKHKGYRRLLIDTLFPSPWWLRLHYGVNRLAPIWYHWCQHLLNLLAEALRRRSPHFEQD